VPGYVCSTSIQKQSRNDGEWHKLMQKNEECFCKLALAGPANKFYPRPALTNLAEPYKKSGLVKWALKRVDMYCSSLDFLGFLLDKPREQAYRACSL
jgi:hypothetical protein